jgi:hypothetical protein
MRKPLHRLGYVLAVGALLALPAAMAGQAKSSPFDGFGKDQKFLGVHVGMSGVGSTANYGVNGEVAVTRNIGVGGWLDTWSYGQSFGTALGSYDWNVRYIAVAGTGAYHFAIKDNPKVDPFAGAALGYYIVSESTNATGAGTYQGSASRMFLGGYGGVRYFFKPQLSGVARLGFGSSYLTLGLDYRMK